MAISDQLRDRCKAPLLSISGPSGAGKTTLANALKKSYPVFIETTIGNPHVQALIQGSDEFNALANQEWFLQQIRNHIAQADSSSPLILDQDPAAIVLAYSRMFREEGRIDETDYESLLHQLGGIEEMLHGWKCPRNILLLDAPADVLRGRVCQRSVESETPPLKWFERIRTCFVQAFAALPNVSRISTVDYSPEQIADWARSLIETQQKDIQA